MPYPSCEPLSSKDRLSTQRFLRCKRSERTASIVAWCIHGLQQPARVATACTGCNSLHGSQQPARVTAMAYSVGKAPPRAYSEATALHCMALHCIACSAHSLATVASCSESASHLHTDTFSACQTYVCATTENALMVVPQNAVRFPLYATPRVLRCCMR